MYVLLLLLGFTYAELQSISTCQDGKMTTWVDGSIQAITYGLGDLLVEKGLNVGGMNKDAGAGNIKAEGYIQAKGSITTEEDITAQGLTINSKSLTVGTPVTTSWDGDSSNVQAIPTRIFSDMRIHGDILLTNDHSRLMVDTISGGFCPHWDTPKGFDPCVSKTYGASITFNTQLKGEFAESTTDETKTTASLAIMGQKLYIRGQTYIYQGLHIDDEFTAADKNFRVEAGGNVGISKKLYVGDTLDVNGRALMNSYLLVGGYMTGNYYGGEYGIYFRGGYYESQGQSIKYNTGSDAGSFFDNTKFGLDVKYSIIAGDYVVLSDRRIKKDIVPVPDNYALNVIRKLDTKYYHYRDVIKKGSGRTIGFIAQDVKEHIPEAVSINKGFVPNEMRNIEPKWLQVSDNVWSFKVEDLKSPGTYKFFVGSEDKNKEKIITTENDGKTFLTDEPYKNIFLYGEEVDDLHTVKKDKIWAISYAALQQVDKNQQILQEKVKTLEETVAALSERLAALEAR